MADYDINSPNPYVADDTGGGGAKLPVSSIGNMGALGALAYLGQHGNTAMPMAQQMANQAGRMPVFGGGLATEGGQQQLENTLFSRIRSPDQMADAKSQRLGALQQVQQAMQTPYINTNPLTNILSGMMHNDKPWDVGNGFREGVANSMDMKMAAAKAARDAALASAQAGQQFNTNEEGISDKNEKDALGDLEKLARPIRGGIGGAGGAGGVRFKNVKGALVDTWALASDPTHPENAIALQDNASIAERHNVALKHALADAESPQNNIDFNNTDEKNAWVAAQEKKYFDQLSAGQTAPTVPGSAGGYGKSISPDSGSKLPAQGEIDPKILDNIKGIESGKSDGLVMNKDTKALGPYQFTPETMLTLHKMGLTFNPLVESEARNAANIYLTKLVNDNGGDLNKALAIYSGHIKTDPSGYITQATAGVAPTPGAAAAPANKPIYGPEVQKARTATAEALVATNKKQFEQFANDNTMAQNTLQTIADLKQLPFNPGAFAQWQKKGGSIMDALGSNGPLTKQAANSTAAEGLLQNLANVRMLMEHGTQTEDDEVRFKKEIANISNPRQAYDYTLKHMQEVAIKAEDRYNTYKSTVAGNGGTSFDGADTAWANRAQKYGPLVQRYGGGVVGRSEFISNIVNDPANQKAYKGDKAALQQRAEQEWLNMGKGGK